MKLGIQKKKQQDALLLPLGQPADIMMTTITDLVCVGMLGQSSAPPGSSPWLDGYHH